MLILDFPWYLSKARDARTRMKLKEYEKIAKKLNNQKQLIEYRERQKFPLKMGAFKFWLNDNNVFGSLDTYLELFKERHHTKLKKFLAAKEKVIVDLGANEGYYTLKMKEYSPKAKIIAVEPNPEAFRVLQKNIRENNLKNVVLSKTVISEKNGKVDFEIVEGVTQIGGLKILEDRNWLKKNKNRIRKFTTRSITLERLLKLNRIKKVSLLKIDTEGSEMEILKSSERILANIDKIVIEFHSGRLKKQIKKFLRKNCFRLLFEENVECGDVYFERTKM
jgi:FkbM family methyltransferase